MRSALLLVCLTLAPLAASSHAPRQEGGKRLQAADRAYEEGSYELARRAYLPVLADTTDESQRRWLRFRVADCLWRQAAASENPDSTQLDEGLGDLSELLPFWERPEDRDATWAAIERSIAEWYWIRPQARNWGEAWKHGTLALAYWSGSSEIERARAEYLDIVRLFVDPPGAQRWERDSYYTYLPDDTLRDAARIAVEPNDLGWTHYFLARKLARNGDLRWQARIAESYEAVLALGRSNPWYDDALYEFGVWTEERGRLEQSAERGTWTEPDYVGALVLYRRLVEEFAEGNSRHRKQSVERIKNIVGPEVSLSVGQVFMPGSLRPYSVRWRNVERIDLALYELDLSRHTALKSKEDRTGSWLDTLVPSALERVDSWEYATEDDGLHAWGTAELEIKSKLPVGAYLFEATGGGARSRALVLISDAAVVMKAYGDQVAVWFADVEDGRPIAEARVGLWERYGHRDVWRHHEMRTDEEGLAIFELEPTTSWREMFAGARLGERQAFATLGGRPSLTESQRWMMYAFTDRPAYRPGQKVSWKLCVRLKDGNTLSTPANRALHYELRNPRGEVVGEGPIQLNEFGTVWGEFEPEASWTLGEYQLQVQTAKEDNGNKRHLAGSTLFRLEEYKLPEFVVRVEPATDEDGVRRLFSLGQEVEAQVVSEYYFGGAVAEATVEVLVHQRSFQPRWKRPREFPWYFEQQDSSAWRYWQGPGQLILQQTLTTDADGRATVKFETPSGGPQNFEYTIEARVTDSSRREVSGTGTVRVTRQLHFAHAWLDHELYRPRQEAEVHFELQDANGAPVAVEGQVALLRRRWVEVWRDPTGEEVSGAQLDRLRRKFVQFPPPPVAPQPPWRMIRAEWEDVPITATKLTTDEAGEATWTVAPPREGYYIVRWSSSDPRGNPVLTETALWVADERTTELGTRGGELRVLADSDTFTAGEPAHVMLLTPASGRHVLFSVEAEGLIELRVIELTGSVKLLRLDVNERWIPNVELVARSFSGGRALGAQTSIVVPPRDEFLDVTLELEPEQVLPGGEAEVLVTVRDDKGRPVSAEISLSIVDESVMAIQSEYAGDPRSFFYGQRRAHRVITSVSHGGRAYVRLSEFGLEDADGGGRYELQDSTRRDRSAGLKKEARGELADDFFLGQRASGAGGGPSAPGAPSTATLQGLSALGYADADESDAGAAAGGGAQLVVRNDFRETALWLPAVVTDDSGVARAKVQYPQSLTRWRATARVETSGSAFGYARGEGRTRKPLVARLQAPRFLVAGDEATLSLILTNRTDGSLDVAPSFEAEGLRVLGFVGEEGLIPSAPEIVGLDAQGSLRLDWRVVAEETGEARLIGGALGEEVADATELRFPVHAHGIEALIASSGRFEGDELELEVVLPAAREPGTTEFEIQITPSLAVTMLDALPYLVQYPYGCTEQTLSRFVPAVVAKHTLEELGLSAEVAMERVYGGIEAEFADRTQRKPHAGLDDLDRAVKTGVDRLRDFQHGDGGWSWWKRGSSDPFMTAYVVWGLSLARDSGVELPAGMLEAGADRLSLMLVDAEQDGDLVAWMLNALALWLPKGGATGERRLAAKAFEKVYTERRGLQAYGRALLALAAHRLGRADEARVLVRNLVDGVILDRPDASIVQRGGVDRGTAGVRAHWGEDGLYRRWSRGGVEATAFALRALLEIDPQNELVQQACDWLVANRRGAQWSNTRDTAICVLALTEFLQASGELDRAVEYELEVNGSVLGRRRLSGDEILSAPAGFRVPDEVVRDGANEVRIRRLSGSGALYFASYARFTSEEEPIPPRGNEMFLRRQYFKLVGRPTLLDGYVYERVPLVDGGEVQSGERVEVVLTVETKNHLEYLLFEDLKPAGFEATSVRSGEPATARELTSAEVAYRFGEGEREVAGVGERVYGREQREGYTGRAVSLHMELRDRLVAAFADRMPQGYWEIRYDLRAEVPGEFHALPLMGHAMYVPEIRANGAEVRVTVVDRGGDGG